jgi:shikimate kinase
MRYYLIGLPGSGKSYWGKLWAQVAGIQFIDLDKYIEDQEQSAIAEIFLKKGEKYFRDLETHYLKEISSDNKDIIIACGGGTPCFNDNMKLINQHGVSVFINTDTQIITDYLLDHNEIKKRPLFNSLKTEFEVKSFLDNLLKERIEYYKKAQHEIMPGDLDITLKHLRKFSKI